MIARSVALSGVLLLSPGLALAGDFTLSGTVALNAGVNTTGGLSYGETTAEGELVAGYKGLHFGIWVGAPDDMPGDKVEVDLSLGYGMEYASGLLWDLTYTRYWYDKSGDDGYDLTFDLGGPITDQADATFELVYAPDSKIWDASIAVDYALNDKLSLHTLLGKTDGTDGVYGELGLGYSLTDKATFSVLYEDATTEDGALTFTLSYDFDILGG